MKLRRLLCTLALFGPLHGYAADDAARQTALEDLGRALFFDVNLSQDRTQSCATCHDPARAFTDWRAFVAAGDYGPSGVPAPASLGGDMKSYGDRNAPTISYASAIPPFGRNADNDHAGGLFWDGRAASLEEQAGGPPLNPIEMALPDKAAVVARLKENTNYQYAFKGLFGADVFDDVDKTFDGMQQAIAALERTEFFAPYDSKYDRYLRGEYQPTEQEQLGITLFFSNQFTNCNQCHQLQQLPEAQQETFSNYTYHNIGVPVNAALRTINGKGSDFIDHGLLDNPQVDAASEDGKFRVPTLRNVAITAPYMHNGVFNDLATVMRFYNKYLAKGSKAQINPETGARWDPPEVAANISTDKLEYGRALDDRSIDALIAFMRMLTDKRYEPLLPKE